MMIEPLKLKGSSVCPRLTVDSLNHDALDLSSTCFAISLDLTTHYSIVAVVVGATALGWAFMSLPYIDQTLVR